jgi:site-specific recombinase XerD
MNYIDDFLEYLLIVKKHSDNTIINYRTDLLKFNEFMNGK